MIIQQDRIRCFSTLCSLFLFQGAGEEAVEWVMQQPDAVVKSFASGQVVFAPREYFNSLCVILSGVARAEKTSVRKNVLLREMERGDLFGAAALFGPKEDYVASITAKTDCRILFLPQDLVVRLMERFPTVSRNYIAFLSDRIRYLNKKIDSFTAPGAESRLAGYLLDLPAKENRVIIPVALSRLSELLDIGRASLYRAFDALEEAGAIHREERAVTLLNEPLLRQYIA